LPWSLEFDVRRPRSRKSRSPDVNSLLDSYRKLVASQTNNSLTPTEASILTQLSLRLQGV